MKIVLTGATGFVGSEVLRQALDDSSIDQITVLTRRPVGMSHPRLNEIVLKDFLDYSGVADHLKVDACIKPERFQFSPGFHPACKTRPKATPLSNLVQANRLGCGSLYG